jgi:TRAP-type C4-dicarboxylate transport system substrate-binding protein
MIQALGAAPVGMSITQVAESLNRGVIDGLLSSWSALRSFRIMPLLKSHYDEPLGVRAFILGINKAVFDKLPREDRDVIVANSGEKQSRHHGKMADEEVASAKAEARQDPNRIFVSPSNEEMAKRREAFRRKYYQEWTAEHPNGEKILTTFEAILADVRAGK